MNIHAHIIAWNEEKILPFVLDYYSIICSKIFVYDNMSTDSSDEIYQKYNKVEVVKWESDDSMNDDMNRKIKSLEYRNRSRNKNVDWVITCDCDEILYHPNLIEKLQEYKEKGVQVPKIDGRDMFSKKFPVYDGRLITELVQYGSHETYEPMSKNIIFDTNVDMVFGFGAHQSNAQDYVMSESPELMLLHYKYLAPEYVIKRYETLASRQSTFNRQHNLNTHYRLKNAVEYTAYLNKNAIKLI